MRADCWLEFDLFFFQSSYSRDLARAVMERFAPYGRNRTGTAEVYFRVVIGPQEPLVLKLEEAAAL